MNKGKQMVNQIENFRSCFQNQAESSILHRAIIEEDDATPLQLEDQE